MTAHEDLAQRLFRLLTYYRRQVWWITSRLIVLTVIVTAVAMAVAPKYVARTKFTLLPSRSEIAFASVRPEAWGLSPVTLLGQTHTEALLSRTLAEDVARTLMAESAAELNNGGFWGAVRRSVVGPVTGTINGGLTLLNTGRLETPDPLTSLAQLIQSRTQVQSLPGSFVFRVAVSWENPKLAARIANLLTEHYVRMTVKASQEEMQTTRAYIEERIKVTQDDLADVDAKIKAYRVGERLYTASTDLDLELREMSEYSRDLSATRVGGQQLDARINALKPYQTPMSLAAIEAERTGLKTRQEALEKIIEEQMSKLDKLPAKEAGLLDLYRERALLERAFAGLQDRLLDTRVAEAAQLSTARVLDPAIPPLYPESPHLLRNAALAIPAGLLLSLAAMCLGEFRNARLRHSHDLRALGPLAGIVPDAGPETPAGEERGAAGLGRFRWMGGGARASRALAVKRHLEHLVTQLTHGERARRCLFVSLTGGEGKTFLIARLAATANRMGLKVLLVDADGDRPALHRAFQKPIAPGFGEWEEGTADAAEIVLHATAGTDVICAGAVHAPLLRHASVARVGETLKRLAEAYDLVLIDTGALRRDPSAVRLLPLADEIVCVFDATSSLLDDVETVGDRIAGVAAQVRCVLNRVRHEPDYLFGSENGHPSMTVAEAELAGLTAARSEAESGDQTVL